MAKSQKRYLVLLVFGLLVIIAAGVWMVFGRKTQIYEKTEEIFVFSPKEKYENEKTKIENKLLSVLQSELVIISDKDIQNIFNYIDSVRLDNPNTYQGKNFTSLLLKKDSDVSALIKQLKNDGFSLVFDKID